MARFSSEAEAAAQLDEVQRYFSEYVEDPHKVDETEFGPNVVLAMEIAGAFPQFTVGILAILRVPTDMRKGITARALGAMGERVKARQTNVEDALLALGSWFAEEFENDSDDAALEDDWREVVRKHGETDAGVVQ